MYIYISYNIRFFNHIVTNYGTSRSDDDDDDDDDDDGVTCRYVYADV